MPSQTINVAFESDQHKKLVTVLGSRIDLGIRGQSTQLDAWKKAEDTILAYIPTSVEDNRRKNRRDLQGEQTFTTLKIPYSYSILMSAHTYWTSVFFARTPIHQYSGRHGEAEQQIQSLEALIAYQIDTGGAMAPYYLWLYDAGKYGIGILGTYWDNEIIRYSHIDSAGENGAETKTMITEEVEGFSGNRCYNVSPWDFLPDPRVSTIRFQEGEFCAVRKRMAWNNILRRESQGYYMNLDKLREQRANPMTEKTSSRSTLERPEDSAWLSDNTGAKHPAIVEMYEVYVDLVPKEWGLGGGSYPEKWVFTITGDRKTILGAQPLGYAHGKFPFDVLPGEVEAYGSWTRGIPQVVESVQSTMDWLLNSHFYNVRASLNNLFVVDPSKVIMKDFERGDPGGIIRLKPEAYGSDLNTFFKQLPVQDVTQGNFNDIHNMMGIGERVTGINDQIMGAITGSSRKTATEVRTSTGFGVNRQKTITEYMSAVGFAPHSQKLVQSSQQYYAAEKKLRIVGDLAQQDGGKFAMVTPQDIAGFYDFVPVDGTLPVDRMAQTSLWTQIFQAMRNFPEIGATYDMAKMFGWVAVLGGLKNINQFKRPPQMQVAPDEQLAAEAQRGNLIPIRPNAPRLTQSDTRTSGVSQNGMTG
jgi:hypothetical protein